MAGNELAVVNTQPSQQLQSVESSIIKGGAFNGHSVKLVSDLSEIAKNPSVFEGLSKNDVDTYLRALTHLNASNEDEIERDSTPLKVRQVKVQQVMSGVVDSARSTQAFMKEHVVLDPVKNKSAFKFNNVKQAVETLASKIPSLPVTNALTKPTTVNNVAYYASYLGIGKGVEPTAIVSVHEKVDSFNELRLKMQPTLQKFLQSVGEGSLLQQAEKIEGSLETISTIGFLSKAIGDVEKEVKKQYPDYPDGDIPASVKTLMQDCAKEKAKLSAVQVTFTCASEQLVTSGLNALNQELASFREQLPPNLRKDLTTEQLAFYSDLFNEMPTVDRKNQLESTLVAMLAAQEHQPDMKRLGEMLYHFLKDEFKPKLDERPEEIQEQVTKENVRLFLGKVYTQATTKAQDLNRERAKLIEGQAARVVDSSQMLQATLEEMQNAPDGVENDGVRERALEYLKAKEGLFEVGLEDTSDSGSIKQELSEFKAYLTNLNADSNIADEFTHIDQLVIQFNEEHGERFATLLNNSDALHGLIKAEAEQYQTMMLQKVDILTRQQGALTDVITALKGQGKPELEALFNLKLIEVANERAQSQVLLSVISEVKLTVDVGVKGLDNVQRFRSVVEDLDTIKQGIRQQNLAVYLEQVPLLRKNNEALKAEMPALLKLEQQRSDLYTSMKTEYGVTNKQLSAVVGRAVQGFSQQLTAEQLIAELKVSSELSEDNINTLVHLTLDIETAKVPIKAMDKLYTEHLVKLKAAHDYIVENGGFPEHGNYNNVGAWTHWLTQEVLGSWGKDYRPSIEQLVLERQLAKNGMSSMAEAMKSLVTSLIPSLEMPLPNEEEPGAPFTQHIQDLYVWQQQNPNEAAAVAKNLTHAYNILASDSDGTTFGKGVSASVNNILNIASMQNQVKELTTGDREPLPLVEQLSMKPEMIALLYLANMTPYVAGAVDGAMKAVALIPGQTILSGILNITGVSDSSKRVLGGIIGVMQTKAESILGEKVASDRNREVMISGIVKALKTEGTLLDQTKALKNYIASREAMQKLGTVTKDVSEVGFVGSLKRQFTDISHWWKHSTGSARAFAVISAIAVGSIVASAVVGAVLLTLGTGGAPLIIAGVLGLASALSSPIVSFSFLSKYLASIGLFGLDQAAVNVRKEMTKQRIEEALDSAKLSESERRALDNLKDQHLANLSEGEDSDPVIAFHQLVQKSVEDENQQNINRALQYANENGIEGTDTANRSMLSNVLGEVLQQASGHLA